MSKKARIQEARLVLAEREFHSLLLICLAECSGGRWGLFSQNAQVDPDDRYWTWPEAKHLRMLAEQIRATRAEAGEKNAACDDFLALCQMKEPNIAGEPKLAASFLKSLE